MLKVADRNIEEEGKIVAVVTDGGDINETDNFGLVVTDKAVYFDMLQGSSWHYISMTVPREVMKEFCEKALAALG